MKKCILLLTFLLFAIFPAIAAVNGSLAMEASQAERDGNWNKVHILAQKIITTNPDDPYGYNLEGKYLLNLEKYEEAAKYFSTVIIKYKSVKEKDAKRLREMGMNEREINEVLNFNSSIANAYNLKGICFYNLSKPNEALNSFINAERYDQNRYYTIVYMKSICLIQLNQYSNALKNLSVAKSLAESEEEKEEINNLIKIVNKKMN